MAGIGAPSRGVGLGLRASKYLCSTTPGKTPPEEVSLRRKLVKRPSNGTESFHCFVLINDLTETGPNFSLGKTQVMKYVSLIWNG